MSNSLAAMRPELVREWSDKNLPITPDKITYGSNKIVWWKAACGHEWQTSVKARSKGENCPICSGARVIAGINDLVTLKPELAQEWSDKNEIKPTEVSVASHKKVIWRCSLGHEWEASVKSRTVNGTGCPYCSHNKVLEGFNDLASQMPEVAAEWSEKNYPLLPTMVTPFANRKVWWKCSKGHEWHTLISTRSGGSKCPYCSGIILMKGFNDFATTQPQLAEEWSDRNLPLTPDMINEKSRKNLWWKCKTCGNEWKSVVYARIKGTVCPVCADRAVLAVYAVKTNTDQDNPREVATMDDSKKQLLKDIFWEMNAISSRTESKTETQITETDDGHGNIVQTETTVTQTYLYITVSHKTVDEIAAQYGFNQEQKDYLAELLKDENNSLWSAVLYGISYSSDQIVTVALSQVGNVGGEPYWSWYGFNGRVEWCACFVSWCANECGYIDTGVIPKFAGCVNGVQWFKDRGQWLDGSAEPVPGMIIFFDWESDGESDHVGIVEKVENGIVYTVEGNSGDSCRINQYAVGHYQILGYGVPKY